jgi:hypothetical protein
MGTRQVLKVYAEVVAEDVDEIELALREIENDATEGMGEAVRRAHDCAQSLRRTIACMRAEAEMAEKPSAAAAQ